MSAERQRPFVDTNILVYAYDASAGDRHVRAEQLVTDLWDRGGGAISIQVLQEFAAVTTQRLVVPLSVDRSAEIIRDYAAWRCHRPSPNDVLQALALRKQHGVSIWDAMILRSAEQLGCPELWSEDFQAGRRYGSVTVVNPF